MKHESGELQAKYLELKKPAAPVFHGYVAINNIAWCLQAFMTRNAVSPAVP